MNKVKTTIRGNKNFSFNQLKKSLNHNHRQEIDPRLENHISKDRYDWNKEYIFNNGKWTELSKEDALANALEKAKEQEQLLIDDWKKSHPDAKEGEYNKKFKPVTEVMLSIPEDIVTALNIIEKDEEAAKEAGKGQTFIDRVNEKQAKELNQLFMNHIKEIASSEFSHTDLDGNEIDGAENILSLSIHYDEGSVHAHALISNIVTIEDKRTKKKSRSNNLKRPNGQPKRYKDLTKAELAEYGIEKYEGETLITQGKNKGQTRIKTLYKNPKDGEEYTEGKIFKIDPNLSIEDEYAEAEATRVYTASGYKLTTKQKAYEDKDKWTDAVNEFSRERGGPEAEHGNYRWRVITEGAKVKNGAEIIKDNIAEKQKAFKELDKEFSKTKTEEKDIKKLLERLKKGNIAKDKVIEELASLRETITAYNSTNELARNFINEINEIEKELYDNQIEAREEDLLAAERAEELAAKIREQAKEEHEPLERIKTK